MSRFSRMSRSQRKHRLKLRRRPINVIASGLTTMGLYCGIASTFAAIKGEYKEAAYWILGAMVFDVLDGTVAKLTKTVSEFGKQLDSLCDVVAFGVAPAVLIFTAYINVDGLPPALTLPIGALRPTPTLITQMGAVMAIIFVICGALRLARFNTYQSERRDYFTGLPIPAAGGTIATFVLFAHHIGINVLFRVIAPLTLVLAFLMVSTIRYPKDQMKSFVLAPRNAFPILVLCVFGIALFHVLYDRSPAIALFPIAMAYVLYGIVDSIYLRVFRKQSLLPPLSEQAAELAGAPPVEAPQPKAGGLP